MSNCVHITLHQDQDLGSDQNQCLCSQITTSDQDQLDKVIQVLLLCNLYLIMRFTTACIFFAPYFFFPFPRPPKMLMLVLPLLPTGSKLTRIFHNRF